jgi:hypothetical protein
VASTIDMPVARLPAGFDDAAMVARPSAGRVARAGLADAIDLPAAPLPPGVDGAAIAERPTARWPVVALATARSRVADLRLPDATDLPAARLAAARRVDEDWDRGRVAGFGFDVRALFFTGG